MELKVSEPKKTLKPIVRSAARQTTTTIILSASGAKVAFRKSNISKSKKMKPITEEEILKSNRFVKWKKQKVANPHSVEKYVTKAVRYIPTREEAMKMTLRTLGLFVAVESLSMRTAKDAVRNAEYWMARGRKEIIEAFFPAPKKFDLNDLF